MPEYDRDPYPIYVGRDDLAIARRPWQECLEAGIQVWIGTRIPPARVALLRRIDVDQRIVVGVGDFNMIDCVDHVSHQALLQSLECQLIGADIVCCRHRHPGTLSSTVVEAEPILESETELDQTENEQEKKRNDNGCLNQRRSPLPLVVACYTHFVSRARKAPEAHSVT